MLNARMLGRLAARLHAAWSAAAAPAGLATAWRRLDDRVAALARARHRIELADRHRLSLSRPGLAFELEAALDGVTDALDDLRAEAAPTCAPVPGPGSLAADLRQLGEEFDRVEVDWRARTLRAVTAPVTLAGIELGTFSIGLTWGTATRSPGLKSLTVVACDPRPAAGKPGVHHPHVQDDWLCAGDAEPALAAALGDGRLADGFLLVRSVLTTYNPRSAYAPLEAWDGSCCSECDRVVVQDDRLICEGCDAGLCDECASSCSVCSATRCGGCLDRCPVCEERCCSACLVPTAADRAVCPACRATCRGCRTAVPADEIDEETGRCPDCLVTDDVPSLPTEEPAPCDATPPTPGG